MYPDLSYILYDLFGVGPDNWASVVKTFGLLLALSFLAAAWLLTLEMKRLEQAGIFKPVTVRTVEGEQPTGSYIAIQALVGALIGYKLLYALQNGAAFRADAASVILSPDGSMAGAVLGAALYGGYRYLQKKRKALPRPVEHARQVRPYELVGDITIVAAIAGLAGAKLFAIFESAASIKAFFRDPLGQLFSGSGLAIYGGLIVAFFAVYAFVKRRGFPMLHMMDAAAPPMIVGYAVGRLGCHFSGDGDWGIANTAAKPGWLSWLPDGLWSYSYPHNVLNEGVPIPGCTFHHCMELSPGVFPTPIYETVLALGILAILWALRRRLTAFPGMLFFLYMVLNGIERFFIEKIRVNEKLNVLGWEATQAEIISVLFVIVGVAGMYWARQRARKG